MRSTLIGIVAALAAAPTALAAQVRPQAGTGDPRVQTVDYVEEQVVLLQTAPGYQLTVEFAPDERIESVAVGDSGAWQVTANRRGNLLILKPLQASGATNMTVVTDARLYVFDLSPLYGPAPDMAYTVRFRYPTEAAEAAPADAAPTVDGRYRLSGDRSLRPSRIGDDGQHTYIHWPKERALPAVYAIDERGQETLVNGMMRDDLFVIDSVAQQLVFRIDRHVARATRVAPGRAR